jgi:hypothetical protein
MRLLVLGGAVLTDKKRIPTEHEEQREVVKWFRQTYRPVRIFAIPNGGFRSRATAGRLKAEGVSPGVPDLFVPFFRFWIEMKRSKGGKLSPEQRDWQEYLTKECGHTWVLCHGADDAKAQISAFIEDGIK